MTGPWCVPEGSTGKALRWHLLLAFSILSSVCSAGPQPERTLWLYQQMGGSSPPHPDKFATAEIEADQIADTLSLAARLAVTLGPVELRVKGSQRFYLELSDAGREQGRLGRHRQTTAGAEIGRTFVASKGHFGRLAAEWLNFLPDGLSYAGILVHTGILAQPDQPWFLGLSFQVRFRLGGTESNLGLSAESERVVAEGSAGRIRVGGAITWTQHLKDGPGPLPTEHALLSMGPSASWDSAWGEWRLRLFFRMWLDRDTPTTKTAYLSEFDLPALSVVWTTRF